MKKTKRSLALLLVAGMAMSMTACGGGSAKVKPLESKQVEADVQEYFTSYVDADSQIVSVYQSQNEISETEKEINCQVKYTTPEGDGSGEVVLQYVYSESSWTLNGCSVDLADVVATVAAAVEEAEETSDALIETAVLEQPEVLQETSKAPAVESTGTVLAGFKLTEAGSFENPGAENLRSAFGALFRITEDETFELYGPQGSVGIFEDYSDDTIGINSDHYGFAIVSQDANNVQLMNAEGELLFDEPAFKVRENDVHHDVFNTKENDRFIKVYYSTEECSENDDYLIDSRGSDDNHTYYKGYIKVFDLEKERFVPGIEVRDRETEISANDKLIVVYDGKINKIYNENGEMIFETTAYVNEFAKNMVVFNVDDCRYVYDANGERYTSSKALLALGIASDYFKYSEQGMEGFVDENGNDCLSGNKFDFGNYCIDGIFMVKNGDDYKLIKEDGTVLYSAADVPVYLQDGWWEVGEDGHLLSCSGIERSSEKMYNRFELFDGENTYTIINTGETLEFVGNTNSIYPGIISTRGASGKYSLYDLFTGEKLLDQEYAEIYYSRGYIYVLDGKTWHSYKIDKIFQ